MNKATLVFGLSKLNSTQLIARSTFVKERMTDNPAFADPTPALNVLGDAIDALSKAIVDALDGGVTATAIKNKRHQELLLLLKQLGGHVSSVAEGNALAILSSGFSVRRKGTPAPEPAAPRDLRATISDHSGRMYLNWAPVTTALTYHVEGNSNDPSVEADWKLVGVSTRARYVVNGLPAKTTCHFRVAGIGTAGKGPWSQVASSLVK